MVHNEGGIHMWKRFVAIGDSFTEGIGDEVEGIALKKLGRSFCSTVCKRYRICQFCKAWVSNARNSLATIGKRR